MKKVVRHRRACRYRAHDPCPVDAAEGLPHFSRPLGLDIIITPDGRGVLVELQHGFGRQGLIKLFPKANRAYRRRRRSLGRAYGTCFEVMARFREVCNDKIQTYRYFSRFQPSSFAYQRWTPKVEQWLQGLDADVVLAKPPRGSCGKGIKVFDRQALLRAEGSIRVDAPALLQELVECRPLLDDEGRAHVGCIRHIVLLISDGERLNFLHLPSYWRVSPVPRAAGRSEEPDAGELVANISRGAFPVAVSDDDELIVRTLSEEVCTELIEIVLGVDECPRGESAVIPVDGMLPEIDRAFYSAARIQ